MIQHLKQINNLNKGLSKAYFIDLMTMEIEEKKEEDKFKRIKELMKKHGIMMDPVEGFDNDEGENTLTDEERENICRNLEELNKEKAAKEAQESQRKIDRIKELMKKCGMTHFPVDYEEAFRK